MENLSTRNLNNTRVITKGDGFSVNLDSSGTYLLDKEYKKLEINVASNQEVKLVYIAKAHLIDELIINLDSDAKLTHAIVNLNDVSLNDKILVNVKSDASYQLVLVDNAKVSYDFNAIVNLLDQGAKAYYDGSVVAKNSAKKNLDVEIVNKVGNTEGLITNYGISEDTSNLVFRGVGQILKGAKNSKAIQKNTMLVLDKTSIAVAKPELLIAENDVVASHANSVGTINDEIMFYLCSRGLSEKQAKTMMIRSYLDPVLAKLEDERLVDMINETIEKEGL